MSQKVKEFVRQSGIEVQTPNSASTTASNDNFAKNLEMNLLAKQAFPQNLQKNLVNKAKYGEFSQFIDDSNNNLDNEFGDITAMLENKNIAALLAPATLEVSKLNPGMFNATVNASFGKQPRLDISTILMKRPIGKTYVGDGLYIDTTEIKGLYGQFKTGFSHTREYGIKGGMNKNFFSAQLMLKISNAVETKGATVNFYRNGKIRFSGGFVGDTIVKQPEIIRKYVVDTYTGREQFLYNPFEYNNLSGQFRINGMFKSLAAIASKYKTYGMTYASYEPEITPFLYAYFGDTKFIVTGTGNIQISGANSPAELLNAYTIGQRFVEKLDDDGQVRVTGEFSEAVKKTVKAKAVAKAAAKPKGKPSPKPKGSPVVDNIVNTLTIVSKRCERLKKPELISLARKMGVIDFRTKVQNGTRDATKKEICERIRGKTVIPTFKNNKTNITLTGTNKTFRVGKMLCANMKKDELVRIATILKIPVTEYDSKISLCRKIQAVKNAPPPPPKPKTPPRVVVAAAKRVQAVNTKRAETMKKRGLDDASIRKDIMKLYGERWVKRYNPSLNDDVRNMKKALTIINAGNKLGIPFKKDVDYVKKKIVERWKFDRKMNLEKKYLANKVNVSGIQSQLRNAYRRAAVNYMMNQKGAVSNKKMNAYKKSWSKFMNTV